MAPLASYKKIKLQDIFKALKITLRFKNLPNGKEEKMRW